MGMLDAISAQQRPAKSLPTEATMKPSVTDGPALLAAAAAVRTNRPAPMMAPMPSRTRSAALSVRLRPWAASASVRSWSIDFLAKSGLGTGGGSLVGGFAGRGPEH